MFQETSPPEDLVPTENIHPHQPDSVANIEKALQSNTTPTIQVRNPITLSYFELQRLVYLQKQAKSIKVQVQVPYRSDPEIQGLRQKLEKSLSSGAKVALLGVHANLQYTDNLNTNDRVLLDLIDLILYLVSDNVTAVQGFGDQIGNDQEIPRFSLISGTLANGGSFSLNIGSQNNTGKNLTVVQVILSTGEALNVSTEGNNASSSGNEGHNGTLEDAARALRVYSCAVHSLETRKRIPLKHAQDKVVAVRTIGTADFLRAGLFLPASTNSNLAITGIYSAKTDKIKDIFNERSQQGEPFEFFPSHDAVLSNDYSSNAWRPIVYIPSLPGARKDKEMTDALKSGYVVLAEKPAFANADLAKTYLASLDKEHQKRLFFGWHYQHHYVLRKVLEDVNKNTFGKIKHIRTYFSVPKLLDNGRIFDPSQGGAGVDIHSYNLHYTLRLIGFNHNYEIVQSKIESAQFLNPTNPELSKIDFTLNTKLKFSNGTTADMYATFNLDTMLHTEAEVLFEDGTKILCKEFCHPPMIIMERFDPVLIFKAGGTRWENYLTEEDLKNPEYWKTTYERQLEFIRRQATGEEKYDVVHNDTDGLGMEANIKLHEIMDAIFEAGGFAKKPGA